jgi:hypothetical protein
LAKARRLAAAHAGRGDVEKIDKTGLVSAWRQGKKENMLGGNKRGVNGALCLEALLQERPQKHLWQRSALTRRRFLRRRRPIRLRYTDRALELRAVREADERLAEYSFSAEQ